MNPRPFLWRAWLRLRGDILAHAEAIREWEGLPEIEIKERQEKQLARLLTHAHRNVPYYREILGQSGAVDNGGVRLDRFAQIPLLDKPTIRARYDDLLAHDGASSGRYENSSSGSTGEPIQFIQDRDYNEWNLAVVATFNRWVGYEAGMPRVLLWGAERDLDNSLEGRVGRRLRNETWLSTFRMSPATMRRYVETINRVKPVQIIGYAEGIDEIAKLIEREGLPIHAPSSVVTSAEMLYPVARDRIARVFRAPVFNRYGSRELGPTACENRTHRGLIVSAPTHFVEILHPDGTPVRPGELGEIVVTLLTNYSMPLIRYRSGDVGSWRNPTSSYAPAWPGLLELLGRTSDIFVAADGARVHANNFLYIFDSLEFVSQFQIVQETFNKVAITMRLVDPVPDPETRFAGPLRKIADDFRHALGADCEVAFKFADNIWQTPSGKFRHIVSKVAR